ncbi:MAG: glycosyltransferase [Selenomonas sp.]|uniref:glycosyltransferase family 2 protein n=1 Tax=Selenomonas sp. TaxID=2053611 RepID=UPI0025FD463D|nr:glycosyltransferase family 2 protein [Selenomonas sp.]MCI6086306.1 glycosyltransferase [Selenomonas sp.]MDY4417004.1 glycosyltransferase [Selenomonas sp.]
MSALISVIVPVLNNESYLDRCIASILSQTYQDFELLLMVGRCKDASLEKCIAWQRKDARIIIVSRKDHSLGDARNYALPIAKGEYIAYVDADDWVQPTFLETLVTPLAADASVDVSCCGYETCGGDLDGRDVLPLVDGVHPVDFAGFLRKMPIFAVWSRMYRQAWLLEHGITMYDGQCEDVTMYLMTAAVAKKIALCREPLYCYNASNPNSLSFVPVTSFTDFAYAADFAMPFLHAHGVIANYRSELVHLICMNLQNAMFTNDFQTDVVQVAQWFVNKHFPEMASYMRYAPQLADFGDVPVVVFGSGRDAARLLHQLPPGVRVRYLVDNDAKKAGQSLCGVVIRQFDDLLQEPRDIPVIISTRNYRFEIAKQLDGAGFSHWCYIESVLTQDQLRVPIEELTTPEKET